MSSSSSTNRVYISVQDRPISYNIDLPIDATIFDIKSIIQRKGGIGTERQTLIFRDIVTKDTDKVFERYDGPWFKLLIHSVNKTITFF